jgi:hypothetical protein
VSLLELAVDGGELVSVAAGCLGVVGLGGRRGLDDDVLVVAVEVEEGGADGDFEVVGVEPVDAAAGFGAVAVAGSAHVVPVAVVSAVGDGADVLATALRAADLAGEDVLGRVGGPLAAGVCLVAVLLHDSRR